jgi:hypothetical protein
MGVSVGSGTIVIEMPRRLAAVALVVLMAACSTGGTEPPTASSVVHGGADTPDGALRALLSAVDSVDVKTAAALTDPQQVALLVSLDGAPLAQTVSMLEEGVPEASLASFWGTFRDTYIRTFDEGLSDMLIAAGDQVTIDGVDFTLLDVAPRKGSGLTRWMARRDGGWRVDLFATFASTFAQPMRLWLVTLADEPDIAVVRRAIAAQRPSLLAALQQHPLGALSPGVAEQIRGLLADVGATG